MPASLLETLQDGWNTRMNQLRAIETTAVEEGRDLTEAEEANANVLRSQLEQVGTQIESQTRFETMVGRTNDSLAALPTRVPMPTPEGTPAGAVSGGASVARTRQLTVVDLWPTPGDYVHDLIRSYNGDNEARVRIQRAIANEITTDVPGIVPTPIVGDIINTIDGSRPVVASIRTYPMPEYGSSFTRPKITQHTQVGEQTAQKTELPSRKLTVDPIPVNKKTLGGAVDVAFQVVDWTSPSALNALMNDLADEYAIQTEALAAAVIKAAAVANPSKSTISAAGGSQATNTALYNAASQVYQGCGRLPDTLYLSVDQWAFMGGLADTAGRPLNPWSGPMNAMMTMNPSTFASNGPGFRYVVSPQFVSGTMIMAASSFAEAYEDRKGALRVVEPKLLGWEVAYYGYFAAIATINGAFVEITHVA